MKKTPLLDMDRGVLNIDLFVYCVMLPQGESPLRRRQGGFPVAPLDPFGAAAFGAESGRHSPLLGNRG